MTKKTREMIKTKNFKSGVYAKVDIIKDDKITPIDRYNYRDCISMKEIDIDNAIVNDKPLYKKKRQINAEVINGMVYAIRYIKKNEEIIVYRGINNWLKNSRSNKYSIEEIYNSPSFIYMIMEIHPSLKIVTIGENVRVKLHNDESFEIEKIDFIK